MLGKKIEDLCVGRYIYCRCSYWHVLLPVGDLSMCIVMAQYYSIN